jgi:RNA polymerase sigma-70 factor (ECF subfamily)
MQKRGFARYRRFIRPPEYPPDVLCAAIALARDGEEEGARVLYRWLNPSLLRYLRFYAGNAAEDLASEVWFSVAKALRTFEDGPGELRALLFAIARRRAVDHYRRKARTPQLVAIDAVPDPAARDDAELLAVELLTTERAIGELVGDLPPEQAEIVLLRVLGGLEVAEVAALTGKSPVAVRVAQHRALRKLRTLRESRPVTR